MSFYKNHYLKHKNIYRSFVLIDCKPVKVRTQNSIDSNKARRATLSSYGSKISMNTIIKRQPTILSSWETGLKHWLCPVCGKKRNIGNHIKCAKITQLKFREQAKLNAQ
jgi:hypothetical protein